MNEGDSSVAGLKPPLHHSGLHCSCCGRPACLGAASSRGRASAGSSYQPYDASSSFVGKSCSKNARCGPILFPCPYMKNPIGALVLCAFSLSVTTVFAEAVAVERSIHFLPCDDAAQQPGLAGSQCARVTVPLNYKAGRAESAETISLFVRKFPAPQRAAGVVWLIAGGPGESGASLYPFVSSLRRSFPNFDLMVPDHRGTGYSSRLCPAEEAPDSVGGTRLVGAEWGTCFGRLIGHPERVRPFSITTAAWDLKHLLTSSSVDGPSYVYGVSYGTQLVLRTLQLGPSPVKGVVLDSLVPLDRDEQWELSRRSQAVNDVGTQVLDQCDAKPECHRILGQPARAALRQLLTDLGQQSPLLKKIPGMDLKQFLGRMLDVPAARDRIPHLIHDLQQRRTVELEAVMAKMETFLEVMGNSPQLPPSVPLVSVISISENNLRPTLTKAQIAEEAGALLFTSPLAGLMAESNLPTYSRDGYFGQPLLAMPPVLVYSGTLDPKTHYQGALAHVTELKTRGDVRLVSVKQAPHFVLMTAPDCFERITRAFVAGQSIADQSCDLRP